MAISKLAGFKNWLINALADDNKYFNIFLLVITLYSLTGCIYVALEGLYFPEHCIIADFILIGGCFVVSILMRIIHNLAYMKVNNHNDNE